MLYGIFERLTDNRKTRRLQSLPVEKVAGIGFAVGGDVLMTGNGGDRVMPDQRLQQGFQRLILRLGKRLEIAAFQFDTDRKRVALFTSAKRRHACVVRHIVARNELHRLALAGDQKMAGNAQGVDDAEKRMFVGVDAVGKQLFHRARPIFERRQRNIM